MVVAVAGGSWPCFLPLHLHKLGKQDLLGRASSRLSGLTTGLTNT